MADLLVLGTDTDSGITLSLQRGLSADDVDLGILHSTDLDTWITADAEFVFLGSTDNGDGTMKLQFSSTTHFGLRHFWRVRASTTQP